MNGAIDRVKKVFYANFITDMASHSRRTDIAFLSADYITPCSRNDPRFNDCALKSGREALPRIVRGKVHSCTVCCRLGRQPNATANARACPHQNA